MNRALPLLSVLTVCFPAVGWMVGCSQEPSEVGQVAAAPTVEEGSTEVEGEPEPEVEDGPRALPEAVAARISDMAGYRLGQTREQAEARCAEEGGTLRLMERTIHRCAPRSDERSLAHYVDVVIVPGADVVGRIVVAYEAVASDWMIPVTLTATRTLVQRFGPPRSQSATEACATAHPEHLERCLREGPQRVMQVWSASPPRAGDVARMGEAGVEVVALTFGPHPQRPTWVLTAQYQREGYTSAFTQTYAE